jgi:hypothetical protein
MKNHLLAITLFLFYCPIYGQNVISGNISDSTGTPISNVLVTYKKTGSDIIGGYATSNQQGYFKLQIPSTIDSAIISLKHLGYHEKTILVKNETKYYKFSLLIKRQLLPEVTVKASLPIYRRKDTINYSVDAFASKQDRVIGDIIKKLPGIEIDGDRILYQGKPIQKYFINGLDLLEGKYNLANSNLPYDAVKDVQVIENNQPIKILDSLVFSDRASLNIKLKKVTTTGTGKIGIGASPFLRDINLTPMLFTRTFQSINTFQSNNIGDDVSKQLNNLSQSNMYDMNMNQAVRDNTPTSFVSIEGVATPNFNEKKWIDNNINLFSSNFLKKLDNNLELKGSLSYFNDYKQVAGQNYTTFFTPSQNINISENIHNSANTNDVRGSFTLLKNEKKIYLKNNLQASTVWTNDNGNLFRNGSDSILQLKNLQNFNISNQFSAITSLFKKQLLNISSFVSVSQVPQSLSVAPGQFANLFNNGNNYQNVKQDVQLNSFYTDNYVSMIKGFKGITLMPKLGVTFQEQHLSSSIFITDNNVKSQLGNNFINQLGFVSSQSYFNLLAQYRNDVLRVEVNAPVQLNSYSTDDKTSKVNTSLLTPTFDPQALGLYKLSNYWEASASSNYKHQFGSINTLYSAFLLNSYNSIQKFNATVPITKTWSNSVNFNYRNTIKAVFASLGYSYSVQYKNFIYNNSLDSNGFNIVQMSNQNNLQTNHSLHGSYSIYARKIKTVFKTSASYNLTQSDYLFNNQMAKMSSKNYQATLGISNTSLQYFSCDYETNLSVTNSVLAGQVLNNVLVNNHKLSFNFFPIENNIITVNSEYYLTNLKSQQNQLFIDLKYNLALTKNVKKRFDFEISCINLLNNALYTRLYNSAFSIIRNDYQLRPRQLMLTTRFKF